MIYVSIDVGFGMTKAYTRHFRAEQMVIFPSIVTEGSGRVNSDELGGARGEPYEKLAVNGKTYYVGERARLESRGTESQNFDPTRVFDESYQVLIAASLMALGIQDDDEIGVVLELPVRDFRDVALRGAFKTRYLNSNIVVENEECKRSYVINDVSITGQGISALYYAVSPETLEKGNYSIVEIGTKTTDFVLLSDMRYVETAANSINVGMHQVLSQFARKVEAQAVEYGIRDFEANPRRVEKQIIRYLEHQKDDHTSSLDISFGGRGRTDMSEPFWDVVSQVARHIVQRVTTEIGNLYDLDGLVLAGGGATAMGQFIDNAIGDKVKIIHPPNPQFANAIGAFDLYTDLHRV